VGQINGAVSQLSQTTQQNASSSEELAATAEEMSSQAEQLQQTMSFFKLGHAIHRTPAPAPAPRASHKPLIAKASRAKPAAAAKLNGFALQTPAGMDESQFARF
jgi:methyl-accepting chemotaxis protein